MNFKLKTWITRNTDSEQDLFFFNQDMWEKV